ncbi:metallophosphoesterase family protein [Salininema proteolyticum]|uniref:Nuclease SbcCD subunit D n=1 Tax=Salininema proteolyticum TaxID=1607685 RepID=A0ABV8U173_9ACTN
MRILHTSDWHVGVGLKGRARLEEQTRVLSEIIDVARECEVDMVIVAGDLYDTAAPSSAAQKILTTALSRLRDTGAEVVAIAGNHDNGPALEALRSWAHAAGIHLRGRITGAADHVIRGETREGEKWVLAALPFVSQRYAVRAAEMFELSAAETEASYADYMRRLVIKLSQSYADDTVNLFTGHLTVVGGTTGGGEREVHTVADYAVPASIFPSRTSYVALGHLHKAQTVSGPCPIRYSGGPVQVDFGEETYRPSVSIVDVTKDTPARIEAVELEGSKPFATVKGTLEQLKEAEVEEDAFLRVFVREPSRAGLRGEIQDLFPEAVQIHIESPVRDDDLPKQRRTGRSPAELFESYLKENGHEDPAVLGLFNELYAESQTGEDE